MNYFDNDVKGRNRCRITGKYRDSTHGDCNIDIKLNHKNPVLFYNLQSYDSHLSFQELDKPSLIINVISNGLEKYMSFTINNEFGFIDSFQFLSDSLDSFVKTLSKDDFKYLYQEFDNNVLDLVKILSF